VRPAPLVLAAFVIAGVAGAVVGSRVSHGDSWGCPVERRGNTVVDGTGSGGSATELSAATDWIPILVEDGTISKQELRAAFAQTSGPGSYDTDTGELRIDGLVQATFTVSQLRRDVGSLFLHAMHDAASRLSVDYAGGDGSGGGETGRRRNQSAEVA
jgi:hypothetical protein